MKKVVINPADNLYKAISDCIEKINFSPVYPEIIIKPNLVAPLSSGSGFVTDVKVVRALIQVLNDKFAVKNIFIAESSNISTDTKKSFEAAGYNSLEAEFKNVRLIDLKDEKYHTTSFQIQSPDILEGKTLINVPVLKGHPQVTLTCAVKNLKGLCRDEDKKNIHKWGLDDHLPLLANFKPELIIVDATFVRESFARFFPRKFNFNRIIAGTDSIDIDSVACQLVGIDINDVPYLKVLKKPEEKFEIINFPGQLAKWKPLSQKIKLGKITFFIGTGCTSCIDACFEAIRPGHTKRESTFWDNIKTVFFCLSRKKPVLLVIGKDPYIEKQENETRIYCGQCAVKNALPGSEKILGCPVDANKIREKLL
ncbi:MAG: DUF362 domain-containing protein [bacterium]|nr:DUF362 domain-containing protein [bacterium]